VWVKPAVIALFTRSTPDGGEEKASVSFRFSPDLPLPEHGPGKTVWAEYTAARYGPSAAPS